MTQTEFEAFLDDESKFISEDIRWSDDEDHYPCVEFRVEVMSDVGYPTFVKASYNPLVATLSLAVIHSNRGRIYALDLGKDHRNPNQELVGEKHKHRWSENFRDKEAYVPIDITVGVDNPVGVWEQFCIEAKITHSGILAPPPAIQMTIL